MSPERPDNSSQKAAAGITALVVIALLGGGALVYANNPKSNTIAQTSPANSTSTAPAPPTQSISTGSSSSTYKDGVYSASSDYFVPPGKENIKVTLTVANGMVTDSSVNNSEYDRESAGFQQDFANQYKGQVVGKPLADLQIGYVAGASDTSSAFNDAIAKIKSEAQA